MFIAKLQGGLGNQLFQWAYVRHLSAKHSVPFYLELSYYDNQENDTPRKFSLDKLPNITYELCTDVIEPVRLISDNFLYDELLYDPHFSYYFDGYWQSEKYFKGSEELIRKELSPEKETIDRYNNIVGKKQNVISLHIRRDDYIRYNTFHPVLPIEYYEEAVRTISDYDSLLIFSDDINWCKEHLHFKRMIFVERQEDIEDLWMMSLCQHHIIANSSFSWWGAWLNRSSQKKIVAPKLWFGDQLKLNTKDIIPENWITI